MGLFVKETSGTMSKKSDPISEGLHHAVCYGVYDLGTHVNEQFGGTVRKVLIQWELPDERISVERDGQMVSLPRAISKQYTLSLHEKSNLRKDLEAWRGKAFSDKELRGFDMQKILGANCQLQILHKTKNLRTFAAVLNVLPWKGEKKTPENPLHFFSFDDGMDIPDGTPEWVADIIMTSDEWKIRVEQRASEWEESDDHQSQTVRELF